MRCELCTRKLGRSEVAHGIRYGRVDDTSDLFIPAKESATTIICQSCGSMLLNLIYQKLNRPAQHHHYR